MVILTLASSDMKTTIMRKIYAFLDQMKYLLFFRDIDQAYSSNLQNSMKSQEF